MSEDIYSPLGLDPAWVVGTEPIEGGIGDGRLLRVTLGGRDSRMPWGAHRVIKLLSPRRGWLGVTSDDTGMRELRLWETGMLQRLPAQVATGVLAWARFSPARHGVEGALLMRDLGPFLLPAPFVTPRWDPVTRLLDAMACLHTTYWNDPRLRDPELGLVSPRASVLLISPAAIEERNEAGDASWYLPQAARGWKLFFALVGREQAARLRALLRDPDPLLHALAALPHTLVHGDVWGPNLAILSPTQHRIGLLDWALATAAPATYDPLWMCCGWPGLDPVRVLPAYRARLAARLAAHGHGLDASAWLALADVGYLRTVLTCGEALGQAVMTARGESARALAMARARWWADRAMRAADRLGL